MLSPSVVLVISIVCILVLLRFRVHPGPAIFAGALILSLVVLPVQTFPSLLYSALWTRDVPLGDQQTLKLLIVIASALALSSLMEEKGLLANLAVAMESIGSRLAVHVVPAVIGLVPLPGGALVSATSVQGLTKRLGLAPEQSTYINYWFRHLWEFSMPTYTTIIITSILLGVSMLSVVRTLAPMTGLSILCGGVVSYWILRNKGYKTEGASPVKIAVSFVKSAWPILLLVPTILLGLNPMIVFPVTFLLLVLQQRTKGQELKKALKYGLNYKILFLLYSVMLFKVIIEEANAAGALIFDMQAIGLPPVLILALLPLIIGVATGISMAFVGIALPLLLPYIALDSGISSPALLLAYTSGMMGILVSPLHLCLTLSSEYFGARLSAVYKYVLLPVLAIEAIAITIYLITGP
jgi:integral membrane protein (TIGR00529 family)